jgi:hypothetical protein
MMAAALAVLAGCRVEGHAAGQAVDSTAALEAADRPGVGHAVFKRTREVVAPGLERVTVSAIVRLNAGQDSARKVMEALLATERAVDTGAAAIRILGYLPPPQGHATAQRVMMIPLAFTDWAPEPGFDSLSIATRGRPYQTRTVFVHDAAMLRGMMRRDSGAAELPPGHMPVPGRP